MRNKIFLLFIPIIIFVFPLSTLFAQDSTETKSSDTQQGQHFIDEDGDGYNDNAPDHDNDGIPNGLDPDWQKEKGQTDNKKRWRYIDLDGDGINDNLQGDQKALMPESQKGLQQQKGTSIEGQENRRNGQQKKKKGSNK